MWQIDRRLWVTASTPTVPFPDIQFWTSGVPQEEHMKCWQCKGLCICWSGAGHYVIHWPLKDLMHMPGKPVEIYLLLNIDSPQYPLILDTHGCVNTTHTLIGCQEGSRTGDKPVFLFKFPPYLPPSQSPEFPYPSAVPKIYLNLKEFFCKVWAKSVPPKSCLSIAP